MLRDLFARAIGFFVMGAALGAALFVLAWGAAIQQRSGLFWGAGFYVSIVGFVGSFVAPMTLVRFVRETHRGETNRFWPQFLGYVSAVLVMFHLSKLGVSMLGPAGIDPALEMYAMLNGVFGFILGGVFGVLVADRLLDRRRYEGFSKRAPGRYG